MKQAVQAVFCAFLLSFLIAQCQAENPGATVAIGTEALATGLSINLPNIITSAITNQTIASITGTTRELGVLEITYNITNILLEDFQFGDLEINTIDEGFDITLTGIVCDVSFDWQYTDQSFLIIHVSDSGTGTMNFSDGKYEMELQIREDGGRPQFHLKKNNLALGNVDLNLDGGANWFYDLFNFVITPLVKQNVQDQAQDIVSAIFDKLNDRVDEIPTTIPLVENIAFDWSLLSDFDTSANDGFGSFYSAGYFVPQTDSSSSPPFTVETLPRRVDYENVQLIISEFTFESLGWALFEAGSLDITIPFGTTSDWRLLLPALYRAYPDQPVEINFQFPVYPSFTLNSTGLSIESAPYMNWNIGNSTIGSTNAFTLLVEISADIDLYFEGSMLQGKAGIPLFDISLYSSNIGSFSLLQLEAALNTALYVVLLPTINNVLRQGIPVPVVYGLTLANPVIEFETGYMYVTGSVAAANATTSSTSFYSLIPYPMLSQLFPNIH